MSFPEIPDFQTRSDFDNGLERALLAIRQLLHFDPGDPLYLALSNQLTTIRQWTKEGKNLTEEQKARVTMSLVAQRELKGDEPSLAALLIGLDNFIQQRMPAATGLDEFRAR